MTKRQWVTIIALYVLAFALIPLGYWGLLILLVVVPVAGSRAGLWSLTALKEMYRGMMGSGA